MTPYVLARPRYHYDSYRYFWELVELSEVPWRWVDQVDHAKEEVVILTPLNGEFTHEGTPSRSKRKTTLIWWNLERPGGETLAQPRMAQPIAKKELDQWMRTFDHVWHCDAGIAGLDSRFRHVTIGSHPGLAKAPREAPHWRWDLATFCYMNHRRETLFAGLRGRYQFAPDGWGAGRTAAWTQSRALLMVHQSVLPGGEQLRMAAAAAWKIPILSESFWDASPLESGVHYLEASYNHLAQSVSLWLGGDDRRLSLMAQEAHVALCYRHSFRKEIERAVEATLDARSEALS